MLGGTNWGGGTPSHPRSYVPGETRGELSHASAVCLTSDIWTSRISQSYMNVTCHFIDNSWQLKSYALETAHLSVSHTAENIASRISEVVALVADNASNAVAAARLPRWKRILCFVHTLNFIVKGVLEANSKLTALKNKCKDIVTFFHHSSKASERHSKTIEGLGKIEILSSCTKLVCCLARSLNARCGSK